MTVISVSLTEKNLEDLDKLQKILGLTGISESIQVCLKSAKRGYVKERTLKGIWKEFSLS